MLRRALTISTAAIFSLVLGFSAANAAFNPNAADPVASATTELAASQNDAAALLALAQDVAAFSGPLSAAQISQLQLIISQAQARAAELNPALAGEFAGLADQVGQGTAAVPGATPGQQAAAGIPNSGTSSEDASDLLPPAASAN